jgi:hypothetical protein
MPMKAHHWPCQAMDAAACKEGNIGTCTGADSSILLAREEMRRPENGHDDLSANVAEPVGLMGLGC